MSQETDVILRSILFQVKTAKTLKDVENAVEVMCTKDVIAAVNEKAEEFKKRHEEKKE